MGERALILAVDVGTSGMKMGVFDALSEEPTLLASYHAGYELRVRNDGQWADIDPSLWQGAFDAGARELGEHAARIEAVALSGTTPGLTGIDGSGLPVYPAILMLDQRSRRQAELIIKTVGLDRLLRETANMPVAGGCSLASILWLRDSEPEAYRKVRWFVHSNGFFTSWLAGEPAMDPSSASLSALYNTAADDRSWNHEIAGLLGVEVGRLPPVIASWAAAGRMRPELAARYGMRRRPWIVIGGNDAVLAAHSLGVESPGEVLNVNGTCEITLVCMDRCLASASYNVRCHVLPGRWLTLYVMNAQGKAYEWFRSVFCSELPAERFYREFLPAAVEQWLARESGVCYVPYLMGSRYSLEPLSAAFRGLTPATTREEMAAAMVKGLCLYQREHLKEISLTLPLKPLTRVCGGAVSPALIRAKQAWMRQGEYLLGEESSLRGAALLGRQFLARPKHS